MTPIDQQQLIYANFFYEILTLGHQMCMAEICNLEEVRRINPLFTKINPERKTIAARAGYSVETVKDMLELSKDIVLKITPIRKANGKNSSNEYQIDEIFFEFMTLMKGCGYLKDPEKYKEIVLNGLAEDPYFLVKKFLEKHRLSTDQIPTVGIGELPTIRSYLKETLRSKVQRPKVPQSSPKKERGVLQGLPISFSTSKNLTTWFAPQDLNYARQQFTYVHNTQGVYNPGGFIYAKALESAQKRFKSTPRMGT